MKNAGDRGWGILAYVFLIISPIVFFSKVIFTGRSLYGGDFISYFWIVKEYIRDIILNEGHLPFWNPYLFSGAPFITNMQASLFYPLGTLYYLLPTY